MDNIEAIEAVINMLEDEKEDLLKEKPVTIGDIENLLYNLKGLNTSIRTIQGLRYLQLKQSHHEKLS